MTRGGLDAADNGGSTIIDPSNAISSDTRHPLSRPTDRGSALMVRFGYANGDTPSTDPVVQIFGRTGSDVWQPIFNDLGQREITLPTDINTDIDDGTNKHTHPDPSKHRLDPAGCRELLVGVKTAYAVSSGDASLAFVQIKVI